ncbi:MAG: extracellular solute-binding protein [Bacteroidales bacterium]|nr:extracellular solute-binding protein [Bacteroidales bacterium]
MSLHSTITAVIGAALVVAGIGGGKVAAQEVNLYSARHYDSDIALYEQFTKDTGIKINRIEGNADQLIARLKSEGAGSPADVFITADAGALWRAQQAGLFQPVTTQTLTARIPANLREPGGHWYGFTRRARVIAYDSDKVRPEEIDDYAKLASPRFKGKLCVRSADSVYNLSLVGAMIEALGPDKAAEWVRGIVANMARPPQGGDRDQIRAVGAGVCEVALTNSYYYIRMASGDNEADRKLTERVKLAFPSLDGKGAHVNISGGGVVANAPDKANAIRPMDLWTRTFARVAADFEISAASAIFSTRSDLFIIPPVCFALTTQVRHPQRRRATPP